MNTFVTGGGWMGKFCTAARGAPPGKHISSAGAVRAASIGQGQSVQILSRVLAPSLGGGSLGAFVSFFFLTERCPTVTRSSHVRRACASPVESLTYWRDGQGQSPSQGLQEDGVRAPGGQWG